MPHVVTQACCGDASCVFACPVNCIHPTPDEPGFATAEMVYIDPNSCVDCGACVKACPVRAIKPHTALSEGDLPFQDLNKMFHSLQQPGLNYPRPSQAPSEPLVRLPKGTRLDVAVVGSGPAGLYAADELLKQYGVQVSVFDRLPVPHGLIRAGVAPDHPETKGIDRLLRQIEDQPGFDYRLGVEVGRDLSHAELAECFDAVIYATGASADRRLNIAGEDLPGSDTATRFVAWYNGHLDARDVEFDLSGERAVVVGNGNVALDVARMLASDPERLSHTDIADHALAALRQSAVREVVILGRRGPEQAAFTVPELYGLLQRDDIDVLVEGVDFSELGSDPKVDALRALHARPIRGDRRRVVLRFLASPSQIVGEGRVSGIDVRANELQDHDGTLVAMPVGEPSRLDASLVLRSVGYRSEPLPGLPFDRERAMLPNDGGRVLDGEHQMPGTYVVGWAKRGPSGFIGTNKSCSFRSVNALLADVVAGKVNHRGGAIERIDQLLGSRGVVSLDLAAWRRVDAQELLWGRNERRPRVKFTTESELREAANHVPEQARPRLGRRRRWLSERQ